MRCPACRHAGTLEVLPPGGQDAHDSSAGEFFGVGYRRCPNPDCYSTVFVVYGTSGVLLSAYPAETIDFDATNLPPAVLASLEEAVKCHANDCPRAAAIMVRRTLEEMCHDRGAQGDTLKSRLEVLGETVVLPKELLEGLDNLRLLGNDAAHIEAATYEQVGEDEVELALDVAKEVLKGVYQYGDLVARLDALKKQPEPPTEE